MEKTGRDRRSICLEAWETNWVEKKEGVRGGERRWSDGSVRKRKQHEGSELQA